MSVHKLRNLNATGAIENASKLNKNLAANINEKNVAMKQNGWNKLGPDWKNGRIKISGRQAIFFVMQQQLALLHFSPKKVLFY